MFKELCEAQFTGTGGPPVLVSCLGSTAHGPGGALSAPPLSPASSSCGSTGASLTDATTAVSGRGALPPRLSPAPAAPCSADVLANKGTAASGSIPGDVANKALQMAGAAAQSLLGSHAQGMLPQDMATTLLTLATLGGKMAPEALNNTLAAGGVLANAPVSSSSSSGGGSSPLAAVPTMSHAAGLMSTNLANCLSVKLDQPKVPPIDYSRYVRRYSSATQCGSNYCKDLNYREHFHCLDCNSRVFVKKEEMIRHFKWHKKRDESLQHGFLRYSPMDDCSEKFPNCAHNRKQTHYHCLKDNCDKVYISTSDVQMHANYHRKDSAIIQEGFQRFRATEDCNTPTCLFYGQRTTHFHCRRPGCKTTFKNKADIEKHKTYHIKDEQLNKDGFKKFMKHEHCSYENCRFSRICNHIHCIRPGCSYVLHSSGQLYSHKRKHERQDTEMAYRKFKLAQSMLKSYGQPGDLPPGITAEQLALCEQSLSSSPVQSMFPGGIPSGTSPLQQGANVGTATPVTTASGGVGSLGPVADPKGLVGNHHHQQQQQQPQQQALSFDGSKQLGTMGLSSNGGSGSAPQPCASDASQQPKAHNMLDPAFLSAFLPNASGVGAAMHPGLAFNFATSQGFGSSAKEDEGCAPPSNGQRALDAARDAGKVEETWQRYMVRYSPTDLCRPECEFIYREHYHCTTDNCSMVFPGKDIGGVQEHAKNHEHQDQITQCFYHTVGKSIDGECPPDCPFTLKEKHYHCQWDGCRDIVSSTDKPFRRLDHYKMHEYTTKLSMSRDHFSAIPSVPIDGVFRRKRGRPPKNRMIEFPLGPTSPHLSQAIYASFKLPKPGSSQSIPTLFPTFQGPGGTGGLLGMPGPSSMPRIPLGSGGMDFTVENQQALQFLQQHQHIQEKLLEQQEKHSAEQAALMAVKAEPKESSEPETTAPRTTPTPSQPTTNPDVHEGFFIFPENSVCPDSLCAFLGQRHFHCVQARCHYVTDREDILVLHSKDFHDNIDIIEGFVFYDRSVDCRLPGCHSNKVNRHFHCTRPNCNYSFVRYSTMSLHEQKHSSPSAAHATAAQQLTLAGGRGRRALTSEEEVLLQRRRPYR
ncbi:hypothetical protein HPB52_003809 [Rhipicephalus sanguineus]|uniref:C2H2-type domain-containing protein n=1 Tax=Rhipicephalus sanguineus TaxID=34632 RepID=A0A9D4SVL0_RHISA|nr:hypothetical protein HPB52_003809 [Rhipicephalus sanguineus]